jgi:death-on-curing protein
MRTGETDVCAHAAAYACWIVRNHPFIDGNKDGVSGSDVFLGLNGLDLSVDEVEAVSTMLSLAAGDIGEHTFANWLRKHARALLRRS